MARSVRVEFPGAFYHVMRAAIVGSDFPVKDRWRSIVLACWSAAPMVILVACAALYGSHTNRTDCDIRIWGAVLSVAGDNGFAYRQAVLSACSGKAGAIVDLLLFTDKTDG
jgi:hypothetical protein